MIRYINLFVVPVILGLLQTPVVAPESFIGHGPFNIIWTYPSTDSIDTFNVYLDGARVTSVSSAFFTASLGTVPFGTHQAGVSAVGAGEESSISYISFINFAVSPPPSPPVITIVMDPSCSPPLGAHAPSIFITRLLAVGRPGSRSAIDFQSSSPDPIIKMRVVVDGIEDPTSDVSGSALANSRGLWFTQPSSGTHTVGVMVMNTWGCKLTRTWAAGLIVP